MAIPKSGSQVKYELLEENRRTAVKTSHLWTAALLSILVICSTVIAFYTTWRHLINVSKENDSLDFLMIGPKKSATSSNWMNGKRGSMYGEAVKQMKSSGTANVDWSATVPANHDSRSSQDYKLVCYYSLASNSSEYSLSPDRISPHLCTHINIAFATVTNGLIQPSDTSDLQVYRTITEFKKKNPRLKVLVSVEWFGTLGELAWVVSSAENRTRFVESAVRFLKENDLDGLDIDWEFPSWPTHIENQTNCFMELLRQLSEGLHSREHPMLLSVAAGAPKPIIDSSYNITTMARYIDYVNVMAYDYHMYQNYLPLTGANAPLFSRRTEQGVFTTLNTNWTVSYWLYKGMPASKIVVGIPTYGHSFTLVNPDNHGWEAPSSGIGSVGSDGFTAYYEVCDFMSEGAQSEFDYESKVPFAYKGKEWVSFDNVQSVSYKAEYAKQHQLGGVMIFSLNTDDGEARCDGGVTSFPLTERVKNTLQDDQL